MGALPPRATTWVASVAESASEAALGDGSVEPRTSQTSRFMMASRLRELPATRGRHGGEIVRRRCCVRRRERPSGVDLGAADGAGTGMVSTAATGSASGASATRRRLCGGGARTKEQEPRKKRDRARHVPTGSTGLRYLAPWPIHRRTRSREATGRSSPRGGMVSPQSPSLQVPTRVQASPWSLRRRKLLAGSPGSTRCKVGAAEAATFTSAARAAAGSLPAEIEPLVRQPVTGREGAALAEQREHITLEAHGDRRIERCGDRVGRAAGGPGVAGGGARRAAAGGEECA